MDKTRGYVVGEVKLTNGSGETKTEMCLYDNRGIIVTREEINEFLEKTKDFYSGKYDEAIDEANQQAWELLQQHNKGEI